MLHSGTPSLDFKRIQEHHRYDGRPGSVHNEKSTEGFVPSRRRTRITYRQEPQNTPLAGQNPHSISMRSKTSINHPPQRLSTKKAAPRGAAFARSFLLIVTQNLFQHIHRRAANRISLSGIEKIAYLDFRPNAHGAIAYIARMF